MYFNIHYLTETPAQCCKVADDITTFRWEKTGLSMVVGTSQPQKSITCKLPGLRRQELQNIDSKLFTKIFPEKKKWDSYWKWNQRMVLRDLVLRRTIKSSVCVKVRNRKTLSVNELNNRGKFCHLLHLLSRGMDLFLQVQPVTWGGGKISSTHPYDALGYQPRQLVQWLNKATGKPTDPAAPWRPQWQPQVKGQVETDNSGLLKCPHCDSLITFLASSAKIETPPPQIYVNTYSKMFPPCIMLHLYSWLGEGHVFVWLCALGLFLIWGI